MIRFVRWGSGLWALLFFLGAAVQYNDPDPLRWIVVYVGATVACLLSVLGKLPRWLPVTVGAVALIWGLLLLPGVLGNVGFFDLFQEVQMDSPEIEIGREAFGLLLIAGWMLVLSWPRRRRMAPVTPTLKME